jgi:hypothetical protein
MVDRGHPRAPSTPEPRNESGVLAGAAGVGLGTGAIAYGTADAAGLQPKYALIVGASAGAASLAGGVVEKSIRPLRRRASQHEVATRDGIRKWLADLDRAAQAEADVGGWLKSTPALEGTLDKYISDAAAFEDDALRAALQRLSDELRRLRDFEGKHLPDDWPTLTSDAMRATNVSETGAVIVAEPTFGQRLKRILHIGRRKKDLPA